MKIGLLTFHREINYGANLQAYALQQFLLDNGFDCEIIDYIPNSQIDHRSWKRKLLHLAKTILISKARKLEKKKKLFVSFQNKYYILSHEKYFGDHDILNSKLKYEVIISGSDQILNLTLSNNSFAYYLPFEKKYKISYASSFGREVICDLEKWSILKYLSAFDHLSFREKSGFEIVKSLIKLNEENIVLDPVFLLEKEKWILMSKKQCEKKYILIYAMEKSLWLERTIDNVLRKKPDHKIIFINGSSQNIEIKKKHTNKASIDPVDFVTLFANADTIITNSFHGLAFSIIFKKEVYCCSHSTRNIRLANLLSLVKNSEKIINEHTEDFEPIEGGRANLEIQKYINASQEYLIKSIRDYKDDR